LSFISLSRNRISDKLAINWLKFYKSICALTSQKNKTSVA